MARSEYAHITPEMVREACRITRLFFSGRDTESSENEVEGGEAPMGV